MSGVLRTAGETLAVRCAPGRLADRLEEGAGGLLELRPAPGSHVSPAATVDLVVESSREPFPSAGWAPVTRDARCLAGSVVVEDVATSGFDVLVSGYGGRVRVCCRRRPPRRTRAAGVLLPQRARLLERAVLLQYPVLWAAGLRGRAPVHACAVIPADGPPMLIVGASGVGKTTAVTHEVSAGARAATDNVGVTEGCAVWGLVEPLRSDAKGGRRSTHGRSEHRLDGRIDVVEPEVVVVLGRGDTAQARPIGPGDAARALTASTYAAGELRRYWGWHAQLAMGTGCGPAHPPVAAVSESLCSRLPCVHVTLPAPRAVRISELIAERGLVA